MDKDKILNNIFDDDPLGLLDVKPKVSNCRTADERLLASFLEINDFFEANGKEPSSNINSVSEYQLYSRLKSLREDSCKINVLEEYDVHNLLPVNDSNEVREPLAGYDVKKEITSIEDLLLDDSLNILEDDAAELFDLKHIPKVDERIKTDFVARREPCKDFDKYEGLFKIIQQDLAEGKRKVIDFKIESLKEGNFYVSDGVLFLLEKVNLTVKEHYREDGTRVREDGRTRCIFENGTESNMLKRSVEKLLYSNGYSITENIDEINEGFVEEFSNINSEDEAVGYIYVLKSKSSDPKIQSIDNLFKIGYSNVDVETRVQNADKEPTYLMAPVKIHAVWKCFNMNTQKLELCLHNFFSGSCLEIDVFDANGKRYTPREWFIAPFKVIEQAIALIINGKVVNFRYDPENKTIVKR